MTTLTFTYGTFALTALLAAGRPSPLQDRRPADRARIDTTFAFENTGAVTLTLPSGEIRVTGWARNEVRVVATTERGVLVPSFSRNRVRLEVRSRSGSIGQTRYDVSVPFGARIDATTASGAINVAGTRSRVALASASGAITASDIKGRSEIESAAGRISLQRVEGTTRITALHGSINISEITGDLEIEGFSGGATHIDHADFDNFRFESVTASLDLDGVLSPQGRHSIETHVGTVTWRVPAGYGATIELDTFRGALRSPDFALTLGPTSRNDRGHKGDRNEYSINGGGTHVSIETFSGSVTIRKTGVTGRRETP